MEGNLQVPLSVNAQLLEGGRQKAPRPNSGLGALGEARCVGKPSMGVPIGQQYQAVQGAGESPTLVAGTDRLFSKMHPVRCCGAVGWLVVSPCWWARVHAPAARRRCVPDG